MIVAHIRGDGKIQSLKEHCTNTAEYAQRVLDGIGLEKTAYLAGLLHDMGKAKQEFTQYLLAAAEGKEPVRGSVNHTFAAVHFLMDRWHQADEDEYPEITAELVAAAVGSHHGLFDCIDAQRNNGFLYRQSKENIGYEESLERYLLECASIEELDELFKEAVGEITAIIGKLSAMLNPENDECEKEFGFYTGILARLLTSAVIEGDRRDTAEFMDAVEFPVEEKDLEHFWKRLLVYMEGRLARLLTSAVIEGDRRDTAEFMDAVEFPVEEKDLEHFWKRLLVYMEGRLDQLPKRKPIDQARRDISDTCARAAYCQGGVYRLNVPTGGGKTLSALRYALTHAAVHRKKRIIFTSPLLSILEQNAKVIRDYVGDDAIILEHHSNVIQEKDGSENMERLDLWTQTWDAPIVITTLVQLLNTCFSGKTGAIRRFHSLCNSIIVIDEVQTVPGKLLTQFNLTVNFLSEICGATIVLCSATQPEFGKVNHPLLQEPQELVPWQEELWKPFRRTQIVNSGSKRKEEIPELVEQALVDCCSLLVVCNTKRDAKYLFENLPDCRKFYLSADMCTKHRRNTLNALKEALHQTEGQEKLVCISTQVIEAGVDISFQRVIRLLAGMDSVVQAAGRCNRHGERPDLAEVLVVDCTNEDLSYLPEIKMAKEASGSLLVAFSQNPEKFCQNLADNRAIAYYYQKLYGKMEGKYQDNILQEHGTMFDLLSANETYADANCESAERFFLRQAFRLAGEQGKYQDNILQEHGTMFDLLSANETYADANCESAERFFLRQAFRLAGEQFRVFDEDTTELLVPYGAGSRIREQLLEQDRIYGEKDWGNIERLCREAREYCVSVYRHQWTNLQEQGAVTTLLNGRIHVLSDGYYDEYAGFSPKKGLTGFQEV